MSRPLSRLIDEIKEVLSFLTTLWGILASITLFFPLVNDLQRFIPIERTSIVLSRVGIDPNILPTASTLFSLFTLIVAVSQRRGVLRGYTPLTLAIPAFGLGALAAFAYMDIYAQLSTEMESAQWESVKWLLVYYPGIFGMFT